MTLIDKTSSTGMMKNHNLKFNQKTKRNSSQLPAKTSNCPQPLRAKKLSDVGQVKPVLQEKREQRSIQVEL